MKALSLLQRASHLCWSLQHLPFPSTSLISVHCSLLLCFLAVPILSFPLSTLPLTSLLPFFSPWLISSIKALLSGLCRGGMLTTPGIVTLREFTPLKVFYHLLLSFRFFSLSLATLCICCILPLLPVSRLLFYTTPGFSHRHKFTLTHTHTLPLLPLLYRSVSGTPWHRLCGERPGLSSTNLTVSRTPQPSAACLFLRVFLTQILETCYVWILKTGFVDGNYNSL